MPILPRLSSLWRNLFHKARKDQELTEEIDAYLEMLIEQKINAGLNPEEARRAALIELGGREQVKEKVREARAGHQLETLLQDLRYAVRMLRRNPGFASIAVLLLALGIGANTAIFSVMDAVFLKSLPVKDPEQLVMLTHTPLSGNRGTDAGFFYESYKRFRDQDQTLSGVLAYYPLRLTVSVNGQPEPALSGQLVTGNYYTVFGVNAALGRTIAPEDDQKPGAHPVCVISDGYWQRRFWRDPGVVGKTIHLSGLPFTIIGVTPPEFFGAEVGTSMDISVPATMRRQLVPGFGGNIGIDMQFRVLGRLRPETTLEQAQASLGLLYQQSMADWAASLGWEDPKERLTVVSGSKGLSELRRQFSQPLFALTCVAGLALLIACANVAGLLLARGVARRKEMAVRLTLGAGRLRLVRQLLTESLLLSSLGSLLGLLFAWWGDRLLLPLLSQSEIPLRLSLDPDLRLFGFTAAISALTGLLFGLAPALVATRIELQSALKQDPPGLSGRRAQSFGRVFVIAQVALSLLLLVGAGLFVRSLQKLQQAPTGFSRENVLVLKLEPTNSDFKMEYLPQLIAFYDELVRRVESLPGVRQASLVEYSPISRREWLTKKGRTPESSALMEVEARPGEKLRVGFMQVFPNSFATLGIPLVAGRDFGPQDSRESQEVAVINESVARHFFGSENPIGRRFSRYEDSPPQIEIIGVVRDAKYKSLREPSRPMFYVHYAQSQTGYGAMTLVAQTAGDPAPIAAAAQREARDLDLRFVGFAPPELEQKPLSRLAETDVWFLTARLPVAARFTYGFTDPMGKKRGIADPLNPLTFGGRSLVELPGAPPQPWIRIQPDVPKGTLKPEKLSSEILKEERAVSVYTPAGYDPQGGPYGLLVLFDGQAYRGVIPTPTILDNLVASKKIHPLVALLVDNVSGATRDRDLQCSAPFADFLSKELLPWARQRYRLSIDPKQTIVGGSSFGGLSAAYCAFRYPEVFGAVLSQSSSFGYYPGWISDRDRTDSSPYGWLTRQFVTTRKLPIRFYLEAGLFETAYPKGLLAENRRMRDVLEAKGYSIVYSEFAGGHEYLNWRGSLADGLIALAGR